MRDDSIAHCDNKEDERDNEHEFFTRHIFFSPIEVSRSGQRWNCRLSRRIRWTNNLPSNESWLAIVQATISMLESIEDDPSIVSLRQECRLSMAAHVIEALPFICELQLSLSASSYRSRCEFANQRASLTVEVYVGFDWPIAFRFLLMLMDNEGSVQSFEQLDLILLRESFNVCGNCATIIQHEDGFIVHLKEISIQPNVEVSFVEGCRHKMFSQTPSLNHLIKTTLLFWVDPSRHHQSNCRKESKRFTSLSRVVVGFFLFLSLANMSSPITSFSIQNVIRTTKIRCDKTFSRKTAPDQCLKKRHYPLCQSRFFIGHSTIIWKREKKRLCTISRRSLLNSLDFTSTWSVTMCHVWWQNFNDRSNANWDIVEWNQVEQNIFPRWLMRNQTTIHTCIVAIKSKNGFPHHVHSWHLFLTLSDFTLQIDELQLGFSQTPCHLHLKIVTPWRDMMDGSPWEDLVEIKLLFLNKFEFYRRSCYYSPVEDTTKSMVNEIIASFRTPFWTEEKSSTRRHRLKLEPCVGDWHSVMFPSIEWFTEEHEDSSFLSRPTCAVLTRFSSEYVDPLVGIETQIDEIFITESRNRFSLFVFGWCRFCRLVTRVKTNNGQWNGERR